MKWFTCLPGCVDNPNYRYKGVGCESAYSLYHDSWDNCITLTDDYALNCPSTCCENSGGYLEDKCGRWVDENPNPDLPPEVTDWVCYDNPEYAASACQSMNVNGTSCYDDPTVVAVQCIGSCVEVLNLSQKIDYLSDYSYEQCMRYEGAPPVSGLPMGEGCCDDPEYSWRDSDCPNGDWEYCDCENIQEDASDFNIDWCIHGTNSKQCAYQIDLCAEPTYAGYLTRMHCPFTCQNARGNSPIGQEYCDNWGDCAPGAKTKGNPPTRGLGNASTRELSEGGQNSSENQEKTEGSSVGAVAGAAAGGVAAAGAGIAALAAKGMLPGQAPPTDAADVDLEAVELEAMADVDESMFM